MAAPRRLPYVKVGCLTRNRSGGADLARIPERASIRASVSGEPIQNSHDKSPRAGSNLIADLCGRRWCHQPRDVVTPHGCRPYQQRPQIGGLSTRWGRTLDAKWLPRCPIDMQIRTRPKMRDMRSTRTRSPPVTRHHPAFHCHPYKWGAPEPLPPGADGHPPARPSGSFLSLSLCSSFSLPM